MTQIRFEFIRVIRDIRGEKPSLITPAIKSHHGLSEIVEFLPEKVN